jgi:uncharacterized protein
VPAGRPDEPNGMTAMPARRSTNSIPAPERSPAYRRVSALPWDAIAADLDRDGFAITPVAVLEPDECAELREGFTDDGRFRSTIDMARYRFGEGSYRYYTRPLPPAIAALRAAAYPPLAEVANTWAERLGETTRYPAALDDFTEVCRVAGQSKPTPLILRYVTGGWNALHQDLYGVVAFPLQLTVALSRPNVDFEGGENLLVELRPRTQSRATSISLPQGHALIFPTRHRPVPGTRGYYRAAVRHGVSTVRSGQRYTLGVIFHDAA